MIVPLEPAALVFGKITSAVCLTLSFSVSTTFSGTGTSIWSGSILMILITSFRRSTDSPRETKTLKTLNVSSGLSFSDLGTDRSSRETWTAACLYLSWFWLCSNFASLSDRSEIVTSSFACCSSSSVAALLDLASTIPARSIFFCASCASAASTRVPSSASAFPGPAPDERYTRGN